MRSSRKVLHQKSEIRRGYGMQKTLIFLGLLIFFAGILWPYLEKIPIGRLPGDIVITRPNEKIYISVGTMVTSASSFPLFYGFFGNDSIIISNTGKDN